MTLLSNTLCIQQLPYLGFSAYTHTCRVKKERKTTNRLKTFD